MLIPLFAFDSGPYPRGNATHLLAHPDARLPLHPQGAGRIRKAAFAATTPLSLVVAGAGLLAPRFAASTRPDAPSDASNHGF
jgi:hypothetical protein